MGFPPGPPPYIYVVAGFTPGLTPERSEGQIEAGFYTLEEAIEFVKEKINTLGWHDVSYNPRYHTWSDNTSAGANRFWILEYEIVGYPREDVDGNEDK